MKISNKNVWPLLDNQKVKEESAIDELKRLVTESENIRNLTIRK